MVDIPTLSQFSLKVFAPLGGKIDPALQAATTKLYQRMSDAMDWLPYNPVSMAALAFQQGQYPFPTKNPPTPAIKQYQDRVDAWNQLAEQFAPITAAVLKNDFAAAQQQAVVLNANADYWDKVAKYTGADFIEKTWNNLWDALAGLRASRDAAKAALSVSNQIIQQYGSAVPASLVNVHDDVSAQFDSLSSQAKSKINVLGSTAIAEAGLGAVLIIAGIAAAAVIAITASIWAIAHEFAAVQAKAAANAQELMKWREQQDAADFNAGKISNEQLVQRRAQNVVAAQTLVDSEGAASIGGALGKAGAGIAMGVGALALLAIGGYFLFRKAAKT